MPGPGPIIASFWVERYAEHPAARERNYPGQLRILDASCKRLGLRHIVLTDHATAKSGDWPTGVAPWATDLPKSLMRAVTEVQARYLESRPDSDVVFVGADCIVLKNPADYFPADAGLCVTYRGLLDKGYPINTGCQMIRHHSLAAVARIYRLVADRCQTYWCADQAALQQALAPLPVEHGIYVRRSVSVGFVPMFPCNVFPAPEDPATDAAVLHFKGKNKKHRMFEWAANHGYAV